MTQMGTDLAIQKEKNPKNPHDGSNLDDFLREEGILEEVQTAASQTCRCFENYRSTTRAGLFLGKCNDGGNWHEKSEGRAGQSLKSEMAIKGSRRFILRVDERADSPGDFRDLGSFLNGFNQERFA